MMSHDTIFLEIHNRLAPRLHPSYTLHHSSGGLPDLKPQYSSDVDISIDTPNPSTDWPFLESRILSEFPTTTIEKDPSNSYILFSIPGYKREVNIYCSKTATSTAVKHRNIELELNKLYPHLVPAAVALKRYANMGTEQAWWTVLEMGVLEEKRTEDGNAIVNDGHTAPWFEDLLDWDRVLKHAEKQNEWMKTYVENLPKA
ncbi:hypothetical protein HDU76_008402 [Blyttiomyces sp. JEL0837]|nr:hypothetical protein HDU76_008402 [Blyttiomyces sp. JEL0837]